MKLEWRDVEEVYGYKINERGDVLNQFSDELLTHSLNQQGIPTVGLRNDGSGPAIRRSVPLLVAKAFLADSQYDTVHYPDVPTPIQLDGDRLNCCVDNLMWRPRWFAIKYHQERARDPFPDWRLPFELIETGEVFVMPQDCALEYGLLEGTNYGIHNCLMNERRIFPYGFSFRVCE